MIDIKVTVEIGDIKISQNIKAVEEEFIVNPESTEMVARFSRIASRAVVDEIDDQSL